MIKMTQFLVDNGATFDESDSQNKRPIYYAIQQDKYDMVKYLIEKGADLISEDKKNMTPTHWANKHNKKEILELLLANGGVPIKNPAAQQAQRQNTQQLQQQQQPRTKTNERKIPRRYVLTVLKDDGHYYPMTD